LLSFGIQEAGALAGTGLKRGMGMGVYEENFISEHLGRVTKRRRNRLKWGSSGREANLENPLSL
jgi:hypothetical protein